MVRDNEAWSAVVHRLQRVGHDWATEQEQQPNVVLRLLMEKHAREVRMQALDPDPQGLRTSSNAL